MKKSKKIGLSLNKKVVSNLVNSQVRGGTGSLSPECTGSGTCYVCSVVCSQGCPTGGSAKPTCNG